MAVLYTIIDRKAMLKLQQELDSVAATKSEEKVVFNLADRSTIHYTNAIVEVSLKWAIALAKQLMGASIFVSGRGRVILGRFYAKVLNLRPIFVNFDNFYFFLSFDNNNLF